ncbi:hypothetical protein PENSPDRAFT_694647 [Peniophora sp. CONT]|nr:hypothetical protein PENSPDRAFT_694647 [Peniophora sp. CONT]
MYSAISSPTPKLLAYQLHLKSCNPGPLWYAADPAPSNFAFADGVTPFKPVSIKTTKKYLSVVRAWHIAQGWPPPLSGADYDQINWTLRGLAIIQVGKRRRPPHPPIIIPMLLTLRSLLDLDEPFQACVWAATCRAFWDFDPAHYLTRGHVVFSRDTYDNELAILILPAAKTARPGEIQRVIIVSQPGPLSACDALRNLAQVSPAGAHDPLFSWIDNKGEVRPLVCKAALDHIDGITM